MGAFARERPEDLLGVGGELGQLVALVVEDFDQAVDVAQVGLARLTTASMSEPRPARPAPSSLKIRRKRCA